MNRQEALEATVRTMSPYLAQDGLSEAQAAQIGRTLYANLRQVERDKKKNDVLCILQLKHNSELWFIEISAQKTHDVGQDELWAQAMTQMSHPEEWQIVKYSIGPI